MMRKSSPVSWGSVFFLLCWSAACATGSDNSQNLDTVDKGGAGGSTSEGGSAGASAAGSSGDGGTSGQGGSAGTGSGAGGEGGAAGGGAGGGAGDGGGAGEAGSAGVAGDGGGGSSGSSGQQGGSAGDAGQGGTGGTDAGGTSGSSGQAGSAGDGGASAGGSSGSSGQGGAAGDGGAAGSGAGGAGNGGQGGAGGGQGGAGGNGGSGGVGSPTGTLVVLASTSGQPYAGAYKPSSGWVTQTFDAAILGQPALVSFSGQAHAVMRVSNGSKELLRKAVWSGGTWSTSVQIGVGYETNDNPSFSANAQVGWVTYRRATKHFAVSFKGGIFGVEGALGNSNPSQAFGQSTAAVAVGGSSEWGVYAGNDEGVYTTKFNGSWGPSVGIFGAGSKNYISPAVVLDEQGQPTVLFVRNTDSVLCTATRTGSDWSVPAPIASDALTNTAPALSQVGGGLLAVWQGNNNDSLYYAFRPAGGSWGAPAVLDSEAGAPSKPVISMGASGADAEVVYTRNGQLRHARFVGGSAASPTVVSGTSNVTAVGAVLVE